MLDGANNIVQDAGVVGGQYSTGTRRTLAACDTPHSPSAPADRDGGQSAIEAQAGSAAVSPLSDPAQPECSGGLQAVGTHCERAAAAHDSPIRGDTGGGGHLTGETQIQNATPAKSKRSGRKAGGCAGPKFAGTQPRSAGASDPSRDPGMSGGDGCHDPVETHSVIAAIANTPAPRKGARTVRSGQISTAPHSAPAAPDLRFSSPLIAQIVMAHRQRRGWINARNRILLQAKAICRGWCDGDKKAADVLWKRVSTGGATPEEGALVMALAPFMPAIEIFEKGTGDHPGIVGISRTLEKLAAELPIAGFVRGVRGVGLGSLASIVGETGDLSEYRSVSAVWKRLGLAVIDGERQRKCADVEKALLHGYSPARRSVMWNAGCGLIGGMGNGKRPMVGEDLSGRTDWTPYEILFVERIRYEAARNPEQQRPPTAEGRESYGVAAKARAKRYVEKRFLRDLFVEWRRVTGKAPTPEFCAEGM